MVLLRTMRKKGDPKQSRHHRWARKRGKRTKKLSRQATDSNHDTIMQIHGIMLLSSSSLHKERESATHHQITLYVICHDSSLHLDFPSCPACLLQSLNFCHPFSSYWYTNQSFSAYISWGKPVPTKAKGEYPWWIKHMLRGYHMYIHQSLPYGSHYGWYRW